MMPQPIAEPAGEPQLTQFETSANCRLRILRFALGSARWRHDNGGVTCDTDAVDVAHGPDGWFADGRDDPPFDDLVKGDSA